MRRRRSTPTRVNATTTAGSSLAILLAVAASAGAGEVRDIKELGAVRSAVIVYPPYTRVKPMIVLEVAGGKKRLLGPGDAIEYKPHPLHGEILSTPRRFKFLRCERDPKDADAVLFVFDVHCDGKTIRKYRWSEPKHSFILGSFFRVERGVYVVVETARETVEDAMNGLFRGVMFAPAKGGIRVVALPEGSALADAGMKVGDLFVAANRRAFRNASTCFTILQDEVKRPVVDLHVRRDGHSVHLRFEPRWEKREK